MTISDPAQQQWQQLHSLHCGAAPSAPEFDIVHHPVKDTLLIVSSLLSLMVHKNNAQYNPLVDPVTLFHSRAVPRISIEAYLTRVLRYIPFTNEVLLNMLVFLDRIGSLSGMEMDASGKLDVGRVKPSGELTDRLFGRAVKVSLSPPHVVDDATSLSGFASVISPSSPTSSPFGSSANMATHRPCTSSSPTLSSQSSPQLSRCSSPKHSSSLSIASLSLTHVPSCSIASLSKNLQNPASSCQPNGTLDNSDLPMIPKRGRDEESGGSDLFDHPQQPPQQGVSRQPSKKARLVKHKPSSLTCSNAPATQCTPPSTPAPTPAPTLAPTPVPMPLPIPQSTIPPNGFRVNSLNIHRLLITCLMVATKFTSDLLYSNARYAMVGGLSLPELNRLELEFLFTIQFELDVKVEELQKVGNVLLRFKHRVMTLADQSIQPAQECGQDQELSQPTQMQQDQQQAASTVASASHHSSAINNATGVGVAQQAQEQKPGRYSIPSPTSPRNGLLPDDKAAQATLYATSQPSSSTSAAPTSAIIAAAPSTHTASTSGTMVIVVSESCSERPQLLSPPEEKHGWEETQGRTVEEQANKPRAEQVFPSEASSEEFPASNSSTS
ncbi:MAG: hypothetical protein J3Q66DRAFT_352138 [Benniella sp.]|nr:MAG: hypothetical protein J3Q66DRAFT_352138 [Benniella sp.]